MNKIKATDHLPIALLIAGIAIAHFMTLHSHGMFMWDEAEYANLARNIAEGEPYKNALRPPMMALSGGLLMFLTGNDSDVTIKISVWAFSLFSLGLVYYLITTLKDRSTALLSAALLGILPSFWQHTSYFLSEIPFIFFFLGAVLFFYKGLYHSVRNFYPAWVLTGGAFLTRYTALVIGLIMVIFFVIALFSHRKELLEKLKNKHFWISPFVGFLVLLPWLIHQQIAHGDFLVGFKIASTQLAIYLPGVSMPWDFYLKGLPSMLGIPTLILCAVGVVWTLYKRDRFGLHIIVVILFLTIWFSQYRYKEYRLITSFLPFWAILGGIGFVKVGALIWKGFKSPIVILIVSALLGHYSFNQSKPFFDHSVANGYPSFTNAMQDLRSRSTPDEVVMGASGPQIRWYADRKTKGIPGDLIKLREDLIKGEWLVLVNFERGQPEYILKHFASRIRQQHVDQGLVQIFRSENGFLTIVGKTSYFSQLISEE